MYADKVQYILGGLTLLTFSWRMCKAIFWGRAMGDAISDASDCVTFCVYSTHMRKSRSALFTQGLTEMLGSLASLALSERDPFPPFFSLDTTR